MGWAVSMLRMAWEVQSKFFWKRVARQCAPTLEGGDFKNHYIIEVNFVWGWPPAISQSTRNPPEHALAYRMTWTAGSAENAPNSECTSTPTDIAEELYKPSTTNYNAKCMVCELHQNGDEN